MTTTLSNFNKKSAVLREKLEWTYADFRFKPDGKPRFVEAVRIDGEAWYLVADAVRLIVDLVPATYAHDVEEDIKTTRLITHKRTGETRRFIDEALFARLLLNWSRGFVA